MRRFQREVVKGTARQFVAAKLAERDERHRRAGESRYLVEPNIKDGKGGLRDLHTLFWLAKYLYGNGLSVGDGGGRDLHRRRARHLPPLRGLPVDGALPPALPDRPGRGAADLRRAARHGASASATPSAGGLRAVERFMKHYFLVAKDVGDLTTILCSALEIEQVKPSPGLIQPARSAELAHAPAHPRRPAISASTTAASTSPIPRSSSATPST